MKDASLEVSFGSADFDIPDVDLQVYNESIHNCREARR